MKLHYCEQSLYLILDKYISQKTVCDKPQTSNPWFTSTLVSKNKRRKLKQTRHKTCNESDRLAYKK